MVRAAPQEAMADDETLLTPAERTRIAQEIADDILGYGPIEPFLRDPDLTEVMVNGPDSIWIERNGRLTPSRVGSTMRRTFAAPSTRSCRGSVAGWTRRARWSTPASPTAAGSTR